MEKKIYCAPRFKVAFVEMEQIMVAGTATGQEIIKQDNNNVIIQEQSGFGEKDITANGWG